MKSNFENVTKTGSNRWASLLRQLLMQLRRLVGRKLQSKDQLPPNRPTVRYSLFAVVAWSWPPLLPAHSSGWWKDSLQCLMLWPWERKYLSPKGNLRLKSKGSRHKRTWTVRLMKYSQQSSRSPVAELKEDFSDVDKACFSALLVQKWILRFLLLK